MTFKIEETTPLDVLVALFDSPATDSSDLKWLALRRALKLAYQANGGVTSIAFNASVTPMTLAVTFVGGAVIDYEIYSPSHSVDSHQEQFLRGDYAAISDMLEALLVMVRDRGLISLEVTRP